MKVLRISLLFVMGLIVLMMAGCPGLYDTRRRALAVRHYLEAPNEETKREVDEARRLDRKDIIVLEFVMSGVFSLSLFAFIRAGKRVHKKCSSQNGPASR